MSLTPVWRGGTGTAVELVLFRLPAPRPAQREAIRTWLADELRRRQGDWRGWQETPQGPQALTGPWQVSLSYCRDHVLCGLSDHGRPGVDLTAIEPFDGLTDVARLYLGPAVTAKLATQPLPQQADDFAKAWSALEARTKAGGAALTEWSPARAAGLGNTGHLWQGRVGKFWLASALADA